jgi:hypothetical protein
MYNEHFFHILDNDPTVTIGFVPAAGRVRKNVGTARVPVRLSTVSGRLAYADFATSDGTARAGVDYVGASGDCFISPPETSTTIDVRILLRPGTQPDKTLRILLSNPLHATLGTSVYTLTIEGGAAVDRWSLYR